MKVLVTGGAGFIGSHVVDRLITNGHEVIVVDNLSTGSRKNINPQAEFHQIDITSPDLENVFKSKPDAVVHCAAQIDVNFSLAHPKEDATVNIGGTLALLELCKKYKVKRFVYANSAAEIGNVSELPITEDTQKSPISPYGISKCTAWHYIQLLAKEYNMSAISLRLANVYGPRQGVSGEGGVVSIFAKALLTGKSPVIFGDGMQTRDFLYVEDAAEAAGKAIESKATGQYNVGTGTETSINHLFKLSKELTSAKSTPLYAAPREGDIGRSVFNVEKIKKDINWAPRTTLKEGLKKTIGSLQ
jgi:UDP-glucose 4-epimerase